MKLKYSTRVVLVFNRFVIKIPISRRGYLQGKNEKILYNKYKHLNLLGALQYECLGVVIMQKYNQLLELKDQHVQEVKLSIPVLNIDNCDLNNIENWGVHNDKPILIDYGLTEYISTLYSKK